MSSSKNPFRKGRQKGRMSSRETHRNLEKTSRNQALGALLHRAMLNILIDKGIVTVKELDLYMWEAKVLLDVTGEGLEAPIGARVMPAGRWRRLKSFLRMGFGWTGWGLRKRLDLPEEIQEEEKEEAKPLDLTEFPELPPQ